MKVQDVYLLMLPEPYESPEHPVPINAMIVHALTLLHPSVPQPDGGMMYRCLTEFPSRTPGCLVPLSTLTFELDGGRLWPQVADWEAVEEAVVRLGRARGCDAMPLGLPPEATAPSWLTFGGSRDAHRAELRFPCLRPRNLRTNLGLSVISTSRAILPGGPVLPLARRMRGPLFPG